MHPFVLASIVKLVAENGLVPGFVSARIELELSAVLGLGDRPPRENRGQLCDIALRIAAVDANCM